jgi:hypothetical protein
MLKTKCSNITQANKYIREIINNKKKEELIEDLVIKDLMKYHPTKKIDIDKVEWLKMKIRPPYNKLALYYKYKNSEIEDDISWILCIRNLYGRYSRDEQYKREVLNAFRTVSNMGTKKEFFINNTKKYKKLMGICSNCYDLTEKITTDHYELTFGEILDNFIEKYNINLYNVDIYENENNEIRLKDENLAKKWLKYHDNRAKYRLLCISCNCHFGSYGYIKN